MMWLNKSYRRNKFNGWNRETRCPLSFVHDIDALGKIKMSLKKLFIQWEDPLFKAPGFLDLAGWF
jgi:hypothetical protein